MRRTAVTLVAVLAVSASSLAAQTDRLEHLYRRYPGVTTHNTRLGITAQTSGYAGVRCLAYTLAMMMWNDRGLLRRTITSVQFDVQDQNAATQEPTDMQIRLLRNGVPGTQPGDLVFQTGPFALPLSSGVKAYRVDVDLGGPVELPGDEFFAGIKLPANASYPGDGLSLHAASYAGYSKGDNPHPSAPAHCFGIPDGQSPVQSERSTPAVGLWGDTPVFNVLADVPVAHQRGPNPSWGFAGLYPNGSRGDGLQLWFHHNRSAGGTMFVFVALTALSSPAPIPGFDGGLCLDPRTTVSIGTAPVPGTGQVTLAPAGLRAGSLPALRGRLTWQAASVSPQNELFLSNAEQTLHY